MADHCFTLLLMLLAGPAITSFLDILLVPLYRLSEPTTASDRTPEAIRQLGEEVTAHLKTVAGPDALLRAYATARELVKGNRSERKKKQAMQVCVCVGGWGVRGVMRGGSRCRCVGGGEGGRGRRCRWRWEIGCGVWGVIVCGGELGSRRRRW